MERKICTHCKIEKDIGDFYNKFTDCKIWKSNRSLQRDYEYKDNLSNQRKFIMRQYSSNKIIYFHR